MLGLAAFLALGAQSVRRALESAGVELIDENGLDRGCGFASAIEKDSWRLDVHPPSSGDGSSAPKIAEFFRRLGERPDPWRKAAPTIPTLEAIRHPRRVRTSFCV
jgi:hypothetical protein